MARWRGVRLAPGVRFAAVAKGAVEAGRFCFVEAEQTVALVQQRVGAVLHRCHELVLIEVRRHAAAL
ncbi:MAG: hypothetical protein QOI26_2471 [Pseudonocardiales bacterium]|nr:hypothetical protein [Pseudonocardiales bacterium]